MRDVVQLESLSCVHMTRVHATQDNTEYQYSKMLKILALLLLGIICQVPVTKAEFFDNYLDYLNLRDTYIPFINDDMDKINFHKGKCVNKLCWRI